MRDSCRNEKRHRETGAPSSDACTSSVRLLGLITCKKLGIYFGNHLHEHVRGQVHTQGIENFWSLLKRGLKGTYVAVEPFHLDRYVSEQVFRFRNRSTKDDPLTDEDRFALAMMQAVGRRLT
jgi:hypothetical protein